MNRVPAPQKYLIYLTWVFAGFMALGGVISVLSDTFDFITRPIAIVGTVLIILFWFAAQQYLKRYPYRSGFFSSPFCSRDYTIALDIIHEDA